MSPTTPTITPAAKARAIVYQTTGQNAPRQIAAVQKALEDTYLRARKRKLPVDLFVSSWGPRERTIMGLTAHYTPEQAADVAFLQSEAAKSVPPSV